MNRVCAALLGLVTLAGPGCVSALPGGASRSAPTPAERSAGEAWDRVRTDPGTNRGYAYGAGFRAGFVAATGGGGTTAPGDWRDGFRHGAATAFEGPSPEPTGHATGARLLPAFPTTTPERPQTFTPAPKSFFVSDPAPAAPVVTRTAPPAAAAGSATSGRVAAAPTPAPAPPVVLAQSQSRPEPTRPPVVVVEVVSAPPAAAEFGPWRPAIVRDP